MNESEGSSQFFEVTLEVPQHLGDAVCNYIIENICSGMVLEDEEGSDNTTIKFYVPSDGWTQHEGGLAEYLSAVADNEQIDIPEFSAKLISSANWEDQYRESVTPVWVGEDLVVRPPWDQSPVKPEYDIILEPKMAFGTGRHETTRSCLKLILEQYEGSGRFLDLGCGSGILAILAGKMGADYIKAIDYDQLACDNCVENFQINKVDTPHDILFGSVEKCDKDEPYQFVAVNIIKETILPILTRLKELVAPGGRLLLAGLLAKDKDEIEASLKSAGLDQFEILPDNEWITFSIRRS